MEGDDCVREASVEACDNDDDLIVPSSPRSLVSFTIRSSKLSPYLRLTGINNITISLLFVSSKKLGLCTFTNTQSSLGFFVSSAISCTELIQSVVLAETHRWECSVDEHHRLDHTNYTIIKSSSFESARY